MDNEINILVTQFNAKVQPIIQKLNAAIEMIAKGIIPEDSEYQKLVSDYKNLCALYEEIYQQTMLLASAETNCPPIKRGLSVDEYESLYNEVLSNKARQQFQLAKQQFHRFLLVESQTRLYSSALAPIQAEIRTALEKLDENAAEYHAEEPDELSRKVTLFLEAMIADHISSDEALVARLNTCYPSLVLAGLVANAYYVPDSLTSQDNTDAQDVTNFKADTGQLYQAEESRIEAEPSPESKTADDIPSPHAQPEHQNMTISPSKNIKPQAPNASSFKKNIRGYYSETKTIIPLLTNVGIMTSNQAASFYRLCITKAVPEDLDDRICRVLDQLTSKNLLAEYVLPNLGTSAFCLTSYCIGSMKKKEAASYLRTFWNLSLGTFFYPAKDELSLEEIQSLLERNDRVIRCLSWVKASFSPLDYQYVQNTFKRSMLQDVIALPASISDLPTYIITGSSQLAEAVSGNEPVLCISDCDPAEIDIITVLPSQTTLLLARSGLYYWNGEIWQLHDENKEKAARKSLEPKPASCPPLIKAMASQEDAKSLLAEPEAMPPKVYQVRNVAQSMLDRDISVLKANDLSCLLVSVLYENRIMEASVLAKAAATTSEKWAQAVSRQLAYALNSPLEAVEYTYTNIAALDEYAMDTPLPDVISQGARISTLLWSHVFPAYAYDAELFSNYRGRFAADTDDLFSDSCDSLKQIFQLLTDTIYPLSQNLDGKCFSPVALQAIQTDSTAQKKRQDLRTQAGNAISQSLPRNHYFTGFDALVSEMIGLSSELGRCMCIIRDQEANDALLQEVFSRFVKNAEDTQFSETKVDEYIDQTWRDICEKDKAIRMNRRLIRGSSAWNVLRRGFVSRLSIVSEWLTITDISRRSLSPRLISQLKGAYEQLCTLLQTAEGQVCEFSGTPVTAEKIAASNLVAFTLKAIRQRLGGEISGMQDWQFIGLLSSCYMKLDASNFPEFNEDDNAVHTFEPWYRMLQHLAVEQTGPETAVSYIVDESACRQDWFANYGVAETLMCYLAETRETQPLNLEKAKKGAKLTCDEERIRFESEFRLACAYGKIDEDMEETAFQTINNLGGRFLEQDDYAFYRRLLQHLLKIIPLETQKRRSSYEARLNCFIQETGRDKAPLIADIRSALEEENFALAEEYLIRLEEGENCRSVQEQHGDSAPDYHQDFLKCYDAYFKECDKNNLRNNHPRNWVRGVLKNLPTFWSSPNQANTGYQLVDNWIGGKGNRSTAALIGRMLTGLGFSVSGVQPCNGQIRNEQFEVYKATCQPDPCGKRDYDHPIAKFGTAMGDTINIVCLFGCKGVNTVIQIMTKKLQLSGPTIALLEGILSLNERRRLAANFKLQTSGQSSFLLIDRILLLYLAALDEGERKIAMLKCTLPYTFEQPYTHGTGAVPDEMFFGRIRERNELCDKNGSHLVYGGRQLGKTALLLRCRSIQHQPADKHYAYHFDIKGKRSNQVLTDIKKKLVEPKFISENCANMEEMCDQLRLSYKDQRFIQLQIFLDEVDEFFAEAKESNYELLRPFTNLMQDTLNQVKFVFAGLHNVAHTKTANDDNSPLLYLGKPLCIAPLSSPDARKLIERPLAYLGFSIGERELALILARTNHYPGLLHLFGYSLLQSVCSNYREYYSPENNNPPFQVMDAQMKAVFKKEDLEKEINQRVDATINGLDPQYRIIANLLAHLYYEDEAAGRINLYGYKPEEIRFIDVGSLRSLSDEDLPPLLNEMVDMGILSYNQEHESYRLRKRNFLTVIGKPNQVEETILQDAEGW